MSGFVAIFDRSGQPVDLSLLENLTRKLIPRGPDGHGTWRDGCVGLGRSLLQTTDEIEPVAGPLTLEGIWLAGDVRLDDRAELLRRLRAAGRNVNASAPDVELLIHAWRLWGEACLQQIAGDFAFVIWDAQRQQLFAARDHFGVVPLFYAVAGDTLLVSNTLHCLLAHPDVDDSLCDDTVADYLALGVKTQRQATFFNGIKRLEPGCVLNASLSALAISRYWNNPHASTVLRYRNAADYVSHFREIFDAAVRDRARCRRVATDLSGGMDASSIAVTLAHQFGAATSECLRAYTYYFESLIEDEEGELGREIAARAGIPFEQFELEALWDNWQHRAQTHVPPEPGSDSIFMSGRINQNRRAVGHGRVIFMGFGGDPLFGSFQEPSIKKVCPVSAAYFLRDMAFCRVQHGVLPKLGLRGSLSHRELPSVLPDRILNAEFTGNYNIDARRRQWLASMRKLSRYGMASDPLWVSLFDAADADFTGLALKARFPFFDLRLLRYMNQIPEFPWSRNKLLLRLSMRDLLPEKIRRRRKTGLKENAFFRYWQSKGPQQWMFDVVDIKAMQSYIDRDVVVKMLRRPQDWTPQDSARFSKLCEFGRWLRDRS